MYFYPDVDDRITNSLIKSKEPYKGYWKKSEDHVISLAKKIIEHGKHQKLLDLGAGIGRLADDFSRCFNEITIIEPDRKRLQKAREIVKCKNVKFKPDFFLGSTLSKNYFDVIICSHVIQHIKTSELKPTFEKIRLILKNDGILVLLTNRSDKNYDVFSTLFLEENDVKELRISENNFNKLVKNKKMILPVHFFAMKTLKGLLDGFSIIKSVNFHFGRDVMIIARKVEN